MQHCTNCGAARDAGANFCGNCGHRFADEPAPEPAATATTAASADDTPYGGEMTVAAVLLSLFMPLIALIVALVMRAGELRPSRRGFLKSWAIASGAWLCTGWIVALLIFSSVASGAGGCKGGIDHLWPPSLTSTDGQHWRATYQCNGGGTKTVDYHGQVP